MTLLNRFNSPGRKRILALDGGGIRGALTLGYLQKIEELLRAQHGNNPGFRLCHYFDLVGGTSTGSIIASALAIGKSVSEIKKLYMNLGGKIFGKKYKWWNIFQVDDFIKAAYDAEPLENELKNVFGDISLGDDQRIKTGLCIVAKRADTNSVWPLINHPNGKYFNSAEGRNKDIPLWKAVRASAAAPTYFLPQIIDVGGGLPEAAFVDGGVSMANNPALQLVMVATLRGFPFKWEMGEDKLLLCSVGTGMSMWDKLPAKVKKNHLLNWAKEVPDMLMQDASWHNQAILQWMGKCDTPWQIDGEIGTLQDDSFAGEKALLSYLRYNVWLEEKTLNSLMKKTYTKKEVDKLVDMSNAASRFDLYDIGEKDAARTVKKEHFPDLFKKT